MLREHRLRVSPLPHRRCACGRAEEGTAKRATDGTAVYHLLPTCGRENEKGSRKKGRFLYFPPHVSPLSKASSAPSRYLSLKQNKYSLVVDKTIKKSPITQTNMIK